MTVWDLATGKERLSLPGRGVVMKGEEARSREVIEQAFASAGLKVPALKDVLAGLKIDQTRAQKIVTLRPFDLPRGSGRSDDRCSFLVVQAEIRNCGHNDHRDRNHLPDVDGRLELDRFGFGNRADVAYAPGNDRRG